MRIADVLRLVMLLDHYGFIWRSLAHTQIKDKDGVWFTDVEKWRKFSHTYTDDTRQVSLLVSSGTSHNSPAGC